jgi:arylformamidase
MNPASRIVSIALLAALTAHAAAGPLRDRIEARREARQAAQQAEDDGYGGSSRRNVPAGVKLVRDFSYGADKQQQFDVYIPKAASNAPVIFMVHGGGWKRGDKAMDSVVENKVAFWATRGFIVVSTNYRMLPSADPVAQARDVALAIRTASDKAASWGGDRDKFILMGHSAGAHLVSLLSSSRELQGDLRWLGTVSLDSAAYDVEQAMRGRHMNIYDNAFGADPSFWRAASPYAQLSREGVPLLAVCSSRRHDSCDQARHYASKAGEFGMRVQVLPKDLSHREINETLGLPGVYTEEVDQFIRGLLNGRYPVR